MKKRLIACLLILCTLFSVSSMAFAAPMTAQLAIEATWVDAGDFREGLARVFDGEKWGYINTDGTVVIEPTWDIAGDFSEGFAAVALVESGEETQTPDKETWYFINYNGEICYDLGENNGYYYDTLPYVSGLSNGTYLIAPGGGSTYSLGTIRPEATLPIESFPSGTAYKDGYTIVSAAATGTFTRPDELERLVGVLGVEALPDMLVDLNGTVTWDADWGVILAVDNGLVTYHSRTAGLWGIDTIDGKELVKAEIEDLVYRRTNGTYAVFSEGYATVIIDNICYAVDTSGNLTELEVAAIGRYAEGLFP
ncbi:MAG: WG repeat-containing protein, partial [Clostridia bacterium]|nr:WG repeat-containing protein [Clostridia bacterium]